MIRKKHKKYIDLFFLVHTFQLTLNTKKSNSWKWRLLPSSISDVGQTHMKNILEDLPNAGGSQTESLTCHKRFIIRFDSQIDLEIKMKSKILELLHIYF